MALSILKEIRKIYAAVNADELRGEAHKTFTVGLLASSEDVYEAMESVLAPASMGQQARENALRLTRRAGIAPVGGFDFVLCEQGLPVPANGYVFDPGQPQTAISDIAAAYPSLELAIARNFPGFRRAVADRVIHRIARENAFFSLVTALPNVIPNVLDLPWALGEFATDTAFLTMNQVRMALVMAAAHDRPVGYKEQKMEIGIIAAGAFGWRALARELAGKIPLGGGLIPKAAIAYAGTYVVGMGLEKINRNGRGLTKWEKRQAYTEALAKGKHAAAEMTPSLGAFGNSFNGLFKRRRA